MSAHLHVRTSARLGRKGHKGTVKTDAALPCRGWPVSSGNKNEALLLLHSFPFSTQPLPCQYVFPDMCGAERRLDMLADLDKGRARCPVLAGQQTGITFLFFCALTLLSAAQGKHEWTAMKSTGSCFSQKKALRHPLRLLQKPQAVNGKARGKLTHNGNGGPNGLCPGLSDSDRLRRAGSCQACMPDRDTPIP